jgi:SAM-dependent methyltransferase
LNTQADTLTQWEQAEVARSSSEAARIAAAIKPTSAGVIKRYASPSLGTPFPLEYLYALVGDVRGQHVLDLGCGTGADSVLLASRGAEVSSVDISPELLALADERARLDGQSHRIVTVCASAHGIPVPDESMDLVFGNAILHHLDLALMAREVYRVLKPGGRAIFKEPIRDSRTLSFLRGLIPYRQPDISPFERPLRHDEIRTFASNFTSWHARSFELPIVPLARLLRLPWRVRVGIQRADAALLRRVPVLKRLASITVFEVTK